MILSDPITKVPLIGPSFARILEKLEIFTVKDLLYHIPTRFEDFSQISHSTEVKVGETVTISGRVLAIKNIFTRNGFMIQQAQIADEAGTIDAIWFNQRFLTSAIHKNDLINLSGKVGWNKNKFQLEAPNFEVLYGTQEAIHTGRLVPIYPETAGITSKWLRSRIHAVLKILNENPLLVSDFLSDQKDPSGQIDLLTAFNQVHFPDNLDMAAKARSRLAFDELVISRLEAKIRKEDWQKKTVGNKFDIVGVRHDLEIFVKSLPFELTSSQKKVVDEIYQDLSKQTPMNRLLQGDVGSGKTVVAALAMLAAHLNGFQSVLMAPTEILAEQHFETLSQLLKPLKIGVGIATSSKKDYSGFSVVVGTHALLSDKLNFDKLGLIVIDEQHRFGVTQRAKLTSKGKNPHVLTMTATPIPRTIALTLYGDLDLSVIDAPPKNRQTITTWVVPKTKREKAYEWIREQKTQAFIVCPLIEESEAETLAEVKSAKKEYERLSKEVFIELKLGLLHGQMKSFEKAAILQKFKDKKIDILVSTPVVEVGIDIPDATIMMIEAADRFGLAQLHQLRGRVGRGEQKSYCLLFTENDSPFALKRLKSMESMHSGLELAELDLKMRGPGQRFGSAQHGKWDLKIATFDDLELVEKANTFSEMVLKNPEKFPLLRKLLEISKINIVSN